MNKTSPIYGGMRIHSQQITISSQIGRGSFSTCWIVKHDKHKNPMVLKIAGGHSNCDAMWESETTIHRSLYHPHIVDFHKRFVVDSVPMHLMEWCTGGSIAHRVKRVQLNSREIKRYSEHIFSAIQYLHKNGIIHRDIKPHNLLIDSKDHIKVCDFGLATTWFPGEPLIKTNTGTLNYVAPEILNKNIHGYAYPVDCWSTGCAIYYMFTGKPLYKSYKKQRALLMNLIVKGDIPTIPRQCMGTMRVILEHLLVKDPAVRWTAQQVLEFLSARSRKRGPSTAPPAS